MPLDHDIAGDALRLRALTRCLGDGKVSVKHYGRDSRCDLSDNLPEGWPPDDAQNPFGDALTQVVTSGHPQTIEVPVNSRIYRVLVSPDHHEGVVDGTFAVITDVTDAHERDLALANLLREVSHRSKNLLAIVQAMAVQTANHADSTEEFLRKFRGRLEALASTQDLVTASDWRGANFQSLVAAQLARVSSTTISIGGANPLLRPNAALHVGLALHELATNALLHAGLGSVNVTAQVGGLPGHRILTVVWDEEVPSHSAEIGGRFGTVMLEKIVPLSVGGSAHYQVEPEHVRYRLTMPATQFET